MLFFLSEKDKSTKSIIIKALTANQELTNIQLQRIIKRDFGKKITYQAIRQALTELVQDGILNKKEKLYSINPAWVADIVLATNILEKAIIRQHKVKKVDKETTQIQLKNMYELGHFILFSLENKYFDFTKNNDLYFQLNHLWVPFFDKYKREKLAHMFKTNKTLMIIKGKSIGDRILQNWYKKLGKSEIGVKFSSPCDYIVHGDTVVEIYMAKELQKKMDQVYSIKNVFKYNLSQELGNLVYHNYGIQIIITRNKEIAEQIKEQITQRIK